MITTTFIHEHHLAPPDLVADADAPVTLVTDRPLAVTTAGPLTVYSPPSQAPLAATVARRWAEPAALPLLQALRQEVTEGPVAVAGPTGVFVAMPLFGRGPLYRVTRDGRHWLSSSSSLLAARHTLDLDLAAVARALVPALALHPWTSGAFWRGIQEAHPYDVFAWEPGRPGADRRAWAPPPVEVDADPAPLLAAVHDTLLSHLEACTAGQARVSSDFSGGVDSTSLAFLVHSLGVPVELTHAEADSDRNADTLWALRLAPQLGRPLHILPSQADSWNPFRCAPFPGGRLPDTPFFQAEGEGYLARVQALAAEAGQTPALHLMGLGGDELFAPAGAHDWSVYRQARLRWTRYPWDFARANRLPLLRSVRALRSEEPFHDALLRSLRPGQAPAIESYTSPDAILWGLNWVPPSRVPEVLTGEARQWVADSCHALAEDCHEPLDADRSRHQAIEAFVNQGRGLEQINRLYGGDTVTWHAPFLHPRVIEAVLRLPAGYREHPSIVKPILHHATRGLVPEDLFRRQDKAEHSASAFKGLRAAGADLAEMARDGLLVRTGLVDRDRLLEAISLASGSTSRLNTIEQLAIVERWLRAESASRPTTR